MPRSYVSESFEQCVARIVEEKARPFLRLMSRGGQVGVPTVKFREFMREVKRGYAAPVLEAMQQADEVDVDEETKLIYWKEMVR